MRTEPAELEQTGHPTIVYAIAGSQTSVVAMGRYGTLGRLRTARPVPASAAPPPGLLHRITRARCHITCGREQALGTPPAAGCVSGDRARAGHQGRRASRSGPAACAGLQEGCG